MGGIDVDKLGHEFPTALSISERESHLIWQIIKKDRDRCIAALKQAPENLLFDLVTTDNYYELRLMLHVYQDQRWAQELIEVMSNHDKRDRAERDDHQKDLLFAISHQGERWAQTQIETISDHYPFDTVHVVGRFIDQEWALKLLKKWCFGSNKELSDIAMSFLLENTDEPWLQAFFLNAFSENPQIIGKYAYRLLEKDWGVELLKKLLFVHPEIICRDTAHPCIFGSAVAPLSETAEKERKSLFHESVSLLVKNSPSYFIDNWTILSWDASMPEEQVLDTFKLAFSNMNDIDPEKIWESLGDYHYRIKIVELAVMRLNEIDSEKAEKAQEKIQEKIQEFRAQEKIREDKINRDKEWFRRKREREIAQARAQERAWYDTFRRNQVDSSRKRRRKKK